MALFLKKNNLTSTTRVKSPYFFVKHPYLLLEGFTSFSTATGFTSFSTPSFRFCGSICKASLAWSSTFSHCWHLVSVEATRGPEEVNKRSRKNINKHYETTIRDMGVSKNRGTTKSSILIGFSLINHPFWGTPIFGNTHKKNLTNC